MAHHLETRQTDPPIRPSLACARVSAHLCAARRRAVSSFAFDRVWASLVDPLRFAVFSGAHQPQSVAQNQPPTATPICPMAGPDEQKRRPR